MTKKTKEVLKGDPESSFKLSNELLETLEKSELVRDRKKNPLFAFDLLMAMAEFSALVLKILCASSVAGDDLKVAYMKEILPTCLDSASSIDGIIKDFKMSLMAQPDLN